MIGIETLVVTIQGLDRGEVEHWIEQDWLRPGRGPGDPGDWRFDDIDIARLHLIHALRHELHVEEDALPVVLSLLDQLYDTRRRLRRLCDAVEGNAAPELRQAVLAALVATPSD